MRFLLIRFSSLGDVILTTSVAKNIKFNEPSARVDILTREEFCSVFNNNPNFDRALSGIPRKIKYDYIIDLHAKIKSKIMSRLIPARERLVYNSASYARRLYLHARRKTGVLEKNVIERYQEPLAEAGFKIIYCRPEIMLNPEELENVKDIIPERDYIVISPGAKWDTKKWFPESYIGLAVRVIRELNMEVVLLGSREDMELSNKIFKGAGTLKNHIRDLTGKTGIRAAAAVIKNSGIIVTPDSGLMHLGWAVGAKVVALFGPTVKEFGFQPKDENVVIIEKDMECRPCSLHGSRSCKYHDRACMQRIEVYEVINEIKKFL